MHTTVYGTVVVTTWYTGHYESTYHLPNGKLMRKRHISTNLENVHLKTVRECKRAWALARIVEQE